MDEKKDNLYIVIPAYNEEENIEKVIRQWHPIVEKIGNGSKLVIIDDGSKDQTFSIMNQLKDSYPSLIPLTKTNGGHGATVLYGYHYALSQHADYVFQTDSDGQTLPEEFWQFWKLRKQYQLVIGNRKGRQDGFSRVVVTKVLKLVCLLCFHVSIVDANTPYRLMEAKTLSENLKMVPENFNLSNVILSVIYAKKKQAVKYIRITFMKRQGGVNSINLRKIIKIGKQAVKDFRTINHCIR